MQMQNVTFCFINCTSVVYYSDLKFTYTVYSVTFYSTEEVYTSKTVGASYAFIG